MSSQPPPHEPLELFLRWHAEAHQHLAEGADVVALATADAGGAPAVRFVHFKGLEDGGFTFYSSYESRKCQHIGANPRAAMAFHWQPVRRQVRVEGECHRLERAASERYFARRDRESQLTTVASRQSQTLESFDALEAHITELRHRLAGRRIDCPADWGGVLLRPDRIEFWEGGPHRQHRRRQFDRTPDGWNMRLLYP